MSSRNPNANTPAVTLHMVASLDGFIARHDNDVSWLNSPDGVYPAGVTLDSAEIEKVLASIDCYLMGSRTYEHALQLGWPYGDTPTVVLTSRDLPATKPSVEFHAGDLETLVADVLAPRFRSVWLVGGAMLCQRFLERDLVDKIILTIAPVTLGNGVRLFGPGHEQRWRLTDATAFKNGFVELSYDIDRPGGTRGRK